MSFLLYLSLLAIPRPLVSKIAQCILGVVFSKVRESLNMASNWKEVKCCREEEPSQFDENPQSNSFFQSSNNTINIIEQDSIEVVLSMEGDAKNFVESGRPKSAQNSTSNDWHISAEKERRVFRELEPS